MPDIDFSRLCQQAGSDPELAQLVQNWSGVIEFRLGSLAPGRIRIAGGIELGGTDPTAQTGVPEVVVRVGGAHEDWDKLLSATPSPGWHDVLWASGITIDADLYDLPGCSQIVRRLVELMRDQLGTSVRHRPTEPVARTRDAAVGRYYYVDIAGVQYRIYVEESGSGTPVLLHHTAGGDSRQWRHVLEDDDLQERFRLITYDLPFHGRSLPPTDVQWWQQRYELSREFLLECVVTIARAVEADRPIFVGCSVGGMLAADLAFYRPDDFRAVVGINAALGLPPVTPREQAMFDSWSSPRASGDWRASCMLGRTSPTSPEAYRRETAWIYSQGAPAVHTGDLRYYRHDYDLTAAQAGQIDTSRVGVYLLSGEYDKLTTNGKCEDLARSIAGSHFEVVPGVGHFGPMEDPAAFAPILRRVLTDAQRH